MKVSTQYSKYMILSLFIPSSFKKKRNKYASRILFKPEKIETGDDSYL